MPTPLLTYTDLPPFQAIEAKQVQPALESLLEKSRAEIAKLLAQPAYTWENLILPIEELDDRLSRLWSPVSHLKSVCETPALREAYNACLPLLTDYANEMGQNKKLYEAYLAIKESEVFNTLDCAKQKVLTNALRDFSLSGIALPEGEQATLREIKHRLSELGTQFSENNLDATQAWSKLITDEAQLAGMPAHALTAAKEAAQKKEQVGFLLTLDFPCYFAVVTYCENRDLREEIYTAFATTASDQGPNAGRWDNSPIMDELVQLRHESAQLLGFANYAEKSLATKMADTPAAVVDFLQALAKKAHPQATAEFAALSAFAKDTAGIEPLAAWDISFFSERLREHEYNISQEELRPYFPETKVLPGLFQLVNQLYDITITEDTSVETWHPDARYFTITNADKSPIAGFYFDLYAREHKRQGAWMDECLVRRLRQDGTLQLPVAYLVCNLTPPSGGRPACFTHDEVMTLFHEFGHGLHHMLTQIDTPEVSGINGVPWDAVELPSQFMENFAWEREVLALITAHVDTGETLPSELYERMMKAKNFQSAMQMVRQIEFSLFDFRLHLEFDPALGARIQAILDEVRSQMAVVPIPHFNRFQNSFSHIFAGGYAAGYYSYKWAEVLSSDAYSLFEEKGIFDKATGNKFLTTILACGGSEEPMDLFVRFRGRKPTIDALLRHCGIAA